MPDSLDHNDPYFTKLLFRYFNEGLTSEEKEYFLNCLKKNIKYRHALKKESYLHMTMTEWAKKEVGGENKTIEHEMVEARDIKITHLKAKLPPNPKNKMVRLNTTRKSVKKSHKRNPTFSIWSYAAAASFIIFSIVTLLIMEPTSPKAPRQLQANLGNYKNLDFEFLRAEQTLKSSSFDHLKAGDTILSKSNMKVKYPSEKTELDLAPQTSLTFLEEKHGKSFRLNRGSIIAQVDRQTEGMPMVIETNLAKIVVIGTKFEIVHDQTTTLKVEKGIVEMVRLSDGKSHRVTSGQTLTIGSGLPFEVHAQQASKGPNLIQNPGFEEKGRAWYRLAEGIILKKGLNVVPEPIAVGQSALEIRGNNRFERSVFQDIQVDGGQRFYFTAQVKMSSLSSGLGIIDFIWLNKTPEALANDKTNEKYIEKLGNFETGSLVDTILDNSVYNLKPLEYSEWKKFEKEITAPKGARGLRIELRVARASEKEILWVDDMELKLLSQ